MIRLMHYRLLNRLRHYLAGVILRYSVRERNVLERRIPALLKNAKPLEFPNCEVGVHMLLCRSNFLMGLWAARSFQFFTRRNWKMVFHDDGSLSDGEMALLRRHFPDGQVWRRADADRSVEVSLAGYPHCLEQRRKNFMFLKLFDPFFHGNGDRFILLDSDVLFFKEPAEVLAWADAKDPGFWFNPDPEGSYSVPAGQLESHFTTRLWERVNAGFALVPKKGVDLDVVEKYLAEFAHRSTHDLWLEQTAYALVASLYGKGGLLPETYEISFGPKRGVDCVARHYVGLATSRPHFFREGVVHLAPFLL